MSTKIAAILLAVAGGVALGCAHLNKVGSLENTASFAPVVDSTQFRIELGKQLFYDPILSRDSTISCATCHLQERAFTDGLTTSRGIKDRIVRRNSPTLTNVLNRKHLLLDGVNPSLESQVGVPVQEHSEFDFNILLILDRLAAQPKYVELAKKGYGSAITEFVFVNSIASFERTLISDNSPYDQYKNGDTTALNASQKRGMHLFFDELYCAKCHNGPDFTNERFTNNGLYEVYKDDGRMRLTEKPEDQGIFRVPTLRNIAVTGPYMHDGSIKSLYEVIQHYSSGGSSHKGRAAEIKPFQLSQDERLDLIHFLEALTDSSFLTNPEFRVNP